MVTWEDPFGGKVSFPGCVCSASSPSSPLKAVTRDTNPNQSIHTKSLARVR